MLIRTIRQCFIANITAVENNFLLCFRTEVKIHNSLVMIFHFIDICIQVNGDPGLPRNRGG